MADDPAQLENPYRQTGNWNKTALHFHSTNSDGRLSPLDSVARYAEKGYQVICLSDHEFVSRLPGSAFPGTLLIPNAEISWPHLLHLGAKGDGKLDELDFPAALNKISETGGFSVLCHPRWSNLSWQELRDGAAVNAVEIWNYSCELENATGYSLTDWDLLLQAGIKLWGTAADDTHFKGPCSSCDGGWIMVQSSELSEKAILDSLRAGSYYSSQAPSFFRIATGPGTIEVDCSPAVEMRAVADGVGSGEVLFSPTPKTGWTLNFGKWGTQPKHYLRIEIKDSQGRLAWTNPFFVRQKSS